MFWDDNCPVGVAFIKSKFLAVAHSKTMSEMASELIQQAFNEDETQLTRRANYRIQRSIRRWKLGALEVRQMGKPDYGGETR